MSEAPISPSLKDNPLCSDWLTFSENGRVTLKTAKVEIGQGILTALFRLPPPLLIRHTDKTDGRHLATPVSDCPNPRPEDLPATS